MHSHIEYVTERLRKRLIERFELLILGEFVAEEVDSYGTAIL